MKKITQHQIREQIIFFIYRHLLLNNSLEQTYQDFLDLQECYYFFDKDYLLINDILKFSNKLILKINSYLKKGWNFKKLSFLEQAILLVASYELIVLQKPKAIIINEAIIIAKKYFHNCEYQYINGVLENISNENND